MGVRVPRITLNADFGDDSAFGELSLLSVGYGLHQAWVFATMFGTSSVFGATNLFEGLYGSSVSLSYLISICVYVFCLLFMGLTNQRFLRYYISRGFLIAGAALSFIGTSLLLAPFLPDFPGLEIASGVMTGIGSSVLIIYWGTAFARCDNASIVFNTAVAVFVSFGLFAITLHYAPQPASSVIIAAIPLLELAILLKKTPESFYKRDDVPLFKPLPINKGKFLLRFAVPVFVLGIPLGMLRSQSLQSVMTSPEASSQPMLMLAAGVASILILITIMALGGGDKWSRFFQPLIPFIAVTIFFIPSAGEAGSPLGSTFLIVGFLCFESLMWIFFSDLSQRFRLSPVFVFGIGRGTMAAAVLIGSLAPVAAANAVHQMPFGEQTVVVAMLLIMVIAYAMLPREHEVEAIVVPCPLVKAVSASFEREEAAAKAAGVRNCGTAPELETLAARAEAYPTSTQNAEAPGSQPGAGQAPESGGECSGFAGVRALANAPTENPAETSTSQQSFVGSNEGSTANSAVNVGSTINAAAGSTLNAGSSASSADSSNTSAGSNASSTVNQEVENRHANAQSDTANAVEKPQSAAASARTGAAAPSAARRAMGRTAGESTQDANERLRGGGRFRGKCETVANTYLLSRRETEILFFLAKGHNAAYIQEKLFISEGTAKTHIRHIYRKLDVHNQQDLMRMVEDAPQSEN